MPALQQYANRTIGMGDRSKYAWDSWTQDWGPTGAPNAFYGHSRNAWKTGYSYGDKNPQTADDYLIVGFLTPVYANGIEVVESNGNGFVTSIQLLDEYGTYRTITPTGFKDYTPWGSVNTLRFNFPLTSYRVTGVRINVDVDRDSSYEAIDAVRLSGETTLNVPATGAPSISGAIREGSFLTANSGSISDANGVGAIRFAWLSSANGGITWQEVGSGSSFTIPVQTLRGQILRVSASFTDGAGNSELLFSSPTVPITGNTPPGGVPLVLGTPKVGQVLSADGSGISDADGIVSLTYRWQAAPAGSNSWQDIPAATGNTYTIGSAYQGQTLRVAASVLDGFGAVSTLYSSPTVAVVTNNNLVVGVPMLSGNPVVGQTLLADASGLSDPDGLGSFNWKWQSSTSGSNWVDIPGATASSYGPSRADRNALLRAVVTYVDGLGNGESTSSAPSAPVSLTNTPISGEPGIVGVVAVGNQLSVSTSSLSDADGLFGGFSYQWETSSDGLSYQAIPGATGSTYRISSTDQAKRLRVSLNLTDGAGFQEMAVSQPTAPVPRVNRPGLGTPSLSGSAKVGQTLQASLGSLNDADGIATVSYQWQSAPPLPGIGNRPGTFQDIPGATANSYTLTRADKGTFLQVVALYVDAYGFNEGPFTSGSTALVGQDNQPSVGGPQILGAAKVGQTLTADLGNLNDPDSLGAVTYRWQSADPNQLVFSTVGSGLSYTLNPRDLGRVLRLEASYTDGAGFAELAMSLPTEVVSRDNNLPSGAPFITGIPEVGKLLRADKGSLIDADGIGSSSLFYTWESADPDSLVFSVIQRTGSNQYRLSSSDLGQVIRVTVGYTDNAGFQETVSSAETTPVAPVRVLVKPLLVSASVEQDLVLLQFNTELAATSPNPAAFTLQAGRSFPRVIQTVVNASGGFVSLLLDRSITPQESLTLSYLDLSGDQTAAVLESADGLDVESFRAFKVTNLAADVSAPQVVEATANGKGLILQLNEQLDAALPSTSAFKVLVDQRPVAVVKTRIEAEAGQVQLDLASAVAPGSTVAISYSDLNGDQTSRVVQDAVGNDLESFSNLPVRNDSVDLTPLSTDRLSIDGDSLTLLFNKEIAATMPAMTAFRVDINGTNSKVKRVFTDPASRSVLLTLDRMAAAGDQVTLSYTDADGDQTRGVIEDSNGNDLSSLVKQPVANQTIDRTPLALERAEVEATRVDLFFNKALSDAIPNLNRFRLQDGTRKLNLKGVQTNARDGQVTLQLATTLQAGGALQLSYTDLSGDQKSGVIEDLSGNDWGSQEGINLSNYIQDEEAPNLIDAVLDGREISVQFDELIQPGSVKPSLFSLSAAGRRIKVLKAEVADDDTVVVLQLASTPRPDALPILLSYNDPKADQTNGVIQDLSGNDLASLRNALVDAII